MGEQTRIFFTRRAILDLNYIKKNSTSEWGKKVADKYLADIDRAINRIQQFPGLLKEKTSISPYFDFYSVRSHLMVCLSIDNTIYILTIKHGAMDLPERIAELEPSLLKEAEFLHQQINDKI